MKSTERHESINTRAKSVRYGESIVYLEQDRGQEVLQLSSASGYSCYEEMAPFYEIQETGAFCGLASITIVVNTIFGQRSLSQQFLWKLVLERILENPHDIRYGLTLQQLATLFNFFHGTDSTVRSSPSPSLLKKQFVEDMEFVFHSAPKIEKKYLIVVNFWRHYLNHKGGHFSPIAAYSPDTQEVLVLDVAKRHSKPHWIPLDVLVLLMCKYDVDHPRGYLILTMSQEELLTEK